MGFASDSLKMLPKFRMAARGQLQIFLCAQKLKNLSQKLLKFYNHIHHDMEMYRWFFKVLLKFKMAPWKNLIIFCGRENSTIEVTNSSHSTITSPTIWKCAGDFIKIKMATISRLFKY